MGEFVYTFELAKPLAIYVHVTTVKEDCDSAKEYLHSIDKFDEEKDKIMVHTGTCSLTFILTNELNWVEICDLSYALDSEAHSAMNSEEDHPRLLNSYCINPKKSSAFA